jgi:hypothetical protein
LLWFRPLGLLAAWLAGRLDQGGQQAEVVAFLGVPVHADAEPVPGDFHGLHRLVVWRPAGYRQAVAELVRCLVVRGGHLDLAAEQAAEHAVVGQVHIVRQVAGPVRPVRGQVLGERAAARHGQHVQPAADGEEGQAGLERGAHQQQLEPVPAVLGQVGVVQPLLLVQRGVDVPAAGEQQPVEPADEGGHRVRRHRRQQHRCSPGPLKGPGVADRGDRGLTEPVPPAGRLQLAGNAYDRAAHSVLLAL